MAESAKKLLTNAENALNNKLPSSIFSHFQHFSHLIIFLNNKIPSSIFSHFQHFQPFSAVALF
jgi:hypothetical protein